MGFGILIVCAHGSKGGCRSQLEKSKTKWADFGRWFAKSKKKVKIFENGWLSQKKVKKFEIGWLSQKESQKVRKSGEFLGIF